MRCLVLVWAFLAVGIAPKPSEAAGPQPCAWISILGGRDVPGCGAQASPCRTAQYAHDFVVRPGGRVFVNDLGHFGEPSIVSAFSILGGAISGYGW
jgi:hypothetical protein